MRGGSKPRNKPLAGNNEIEGKDIASRKHATLFGRRIEVNKLASEIDGEKDNLKYVIRQLQYWKQQKKW